MRATVELTAAFLYSLDHNPLRQPSARVIGAELKNRLRQGGIDPTQPVVFTANTGRLTITVEGELLPCLEPGDDA